MMTIVKLRPLIGSLDGQIVWPPVFVEVTDVEALPGQLSEVVHIFIPPCC